MPKIIYDILEELKKVFEHFVDGIFITDEFGTAIWLNPAAEKTGGKSASDVVGRNIAELMNEGYCNESVSLRVLQEKRPLTIIQKLADGKELLVSGSPYWEDGKIRLVITCERDITELNALQERLTETQRIVSMYQNELAYLRQENTKHDEIVAVSEKMLELLALCSHVAQVDSTIYIQGESGTGKELFAKFIYHKSPRDSGPFIKFNCGAIPESLAESELFGYDRGAFTGANKEGKPGIFELAHNGTLFLDEISELKPSLQVKILRVLQEKEIMRVGGKKEINVDVRIIAASNKDLRQEMEAGRFRADLFYRLNVVRINIPPLRERKEDIPVLLDYFLVKYNRQFGVEKTIDENALHMLRCYFWPGNVRELENLVERMVVVSRKSIIDLAGICEHDQELCENMGICALPKPESDSSHIRLKHLEDSYERQLLENNVAIARNLEDLAALLGVSRATANRKMRKYGLKFVK